jgi:hypothetical protein
MSKRAAESASKSSVHNQTVIVPFLVGAIVGGVAGAVVGTALRPYTNSAITALADAIDRIANRRSNNHPKFELLLQ